MPLFWCLKENLEIYIFSDGFKQDGWLALCDHNQKISKVYAMSLFSRFLMQVGVAK